jgi:predicted SAM-dependent methyltransferase
MSTTTQPIVPNKGVLDPQHPRLNIGGGPEPIPGYLTHDAIFGDEALLLPYADESMEEVYACHVFEHLDWKSYPLALTEWVRVLKPGGRLRISVPDFVRVFRHYQSGPVQEAVAAGRFPPLGAVIMGGQTDANDYHKSLWETHDLKMLFKQFGLVAVREFHPEFTDCSQYPFCANIEGRKPTESMMQAADNTVAFAMSIPRLGFNISNHRVMQAIYQFGARAHMQQGAYFDISMEKAINKALDTGRKYIVTVDYDTVFECEHLQRLVMLMDLHGSFDALSAVQLRRGEHRVLVSDRDGKSYGLDEFSDEVVQCRTACFGLTIFRREAFDKMPYPWLRHRDVYSEDGKYRDTIEADMGFWEKFERSGLKLGMATGVCVGHLEEFIVWPGKDYRPVYQEEGVYCEFGRTPDAHP